MPRPCWRPEPSVVISRVAPPALRSEAFVTSETAPERESSPAGSSVIGFTPQPLAYRPYDVCPRPVAIAIVSGRSPMNR